MRSKAWTEKFMQGVFFVAACASVLAVALICVFLFANGIPAMREIGFIKFLTGEIWRPNSEQFGILPMIVGSLYVTAGAIIFGVPIGILTSVFMAMYCPKQIYKPLKAATELLAGIPSVIYGFFGLVVVVPLIREFGTALYKAGSRKEPGKRKQHPDRVPDPGHDDPADHHRHDGERDARRTRPIIMKDPLPLGLRKSAASSGSSSRRPNPASSPASCLASGAPSARPWRSS